MSKSPRKVLRGLSEIRHYFFRRPDPIYYICATNFCLMGMDEWVRGFRYINYNDCFDGTHPRIFVPPQLRKGCYPWPHLEEMNNHMLAQPEVIEHVKRGGPGQAVFLMFDEETVRLANAIGLDVWMPEPSLRRALDDKISGTRIGNRAGVPSVPNALGHVGSYDDLRALGAHLGQELVVQTAFGDSGATTFFIASPADFAQHAKAITAEKEVKVMKRIACRSTALEGCVTRAGTIAGPLMTELVGHPELTPHRGGWSGNEAFPGAFSADIRAQTTASTVKIGDELRRLGYRGYFELDYLIEEGTNNVYLGEINPRITGASPMTNLAAYAHADAPLFLFHLLEFADVDFELDTDDINQRWADPEFIDSWSQMILKYTPSTGDQEVTAALPTGVYRLLPDGSIKFLYPQTHRRTVEREDEAFVCRVPKIGDEVQREDDLAVLIMRGRLQTEDNKLNERAQLWNKAIRSRFAFKPAQPPR